MNEQKALIDRALATLKNYLDGDEHTREEDARFALELLERHLREGSSQDSVPKEDT